MQSHPYFPLVLRIPAVAFMISGDVHGFALELHLKVVENNC